MTSNFLSSALGMVFWIAAARLYPSSTIGRDGVIIGAMITVSSIAQLNLANGLLRFLPAMRRRLARSVVSAYAVAGSTSLLLAFAFVLIGPKVASALVPLQREPLLGAAFVFGTVAWTVFVLQDSVLTAVRRTSWIVFENSAFGVARLPVLFVMSRAGVSDGPYLAWLLPTAALLGPVNLVIFARALPFHRLLPEARAARVPRRSVVRFLARDYAAGLLSQAALSILPVAVIGFVGSPRYAPYAVAFMIVTAFDLVIFDAGVALTVEGAFAEDQLRQLASTIVRAFVGPLVAGTIIMLVAAPLIMAPFGAVYVHEGASLMRLLAGACVFRALIALVAAILRVQRRGGALLAMQATANGMTIGLTLWWAQTDGVWGAGLAWVVSHAVMTAVLLPWLWAYLRGRNRSSRPRDIAPLVPSPSFGSLSSH
jgi:O-antigen/teichoic acid export membrane protein